MYIIRNSEQSVNSTTVLLDNARKHSFMSTSSQNSSPESLLQDTPNTSTTICSSGNPFDFSFNGTGGNGVQPVIYPPQPVRCPQTGGMEYSQDQGCMSNESVLEKFPIYPILEHPHPNQHNHTTNLYHPPTRGYKQSRSYPRPTISNHVVQGGDMVMTDNPNFEEEVMNIPRTLI